MRFAVSNIAWSAEDDSKAYDLLRSSNVSALELAPTRTWQNWAGCDITSAQRVRQDLSDRGFSIPSLQAILFAKPDAKLFGTDSERSALAEHLRFCAQLAAALGATRLVFGAPKNRDRGSLTSEQAKSAAAELFRNVAPDYLDSGVCLCLEANPPQYACNFMTTSFEAASVVEAVGSPAIRLHLDTACMAMAGEDPPQSIRAHRHLLAHFHISEPELGSLANPTLNHGEISNALESAAYDGTVSLEMRAASDPITSLEQSIRTVRSIYGL